MSTLALSVARRAAARPRTRVALRYVTAVAAAVDLRVLKGRRMVRRLAGRARAARNIRRLRAPAAPGGYTLALAVSERFKSNQVPERVTTAPDVAPRDGERTATASAEQIGAAEQRQSADVSRSAIGCERPIVTVGGRIALRLPTGVATGRRSSRVPAVVRWLRVRRALTASDHDAYAAGYGAVSGYRVELEYLSGARPFVAIRSGQVVGGFTLNVDPPFRTMMRMPETERRSLAHEFPVDDTVELTCVWLAPEARGAIPSATLWGTLVWHASRQHRTNVVFGTDVDRLRRFYERTGPRLLYEGNVRVDGHERHGWVYSTTAHRWPYVLARMIAGRA